MGSHPKTLPVHSMPELTGLRGLAALWVLLYHAWVYVTPQEILVPILGIQIRAHVLFSLGWAGVQVFFLLSAFLLTIPYARSNAGLAPRPQVFPYLARRFARVFPAYWVQLIVLVTVAWFVTSRLLVQPSNALAYILMDFVPPPVGIGPPHSLNGVWWTLPIELSFYLVLPLIGWLACWRRLTTLLFICLMAMVGWRYFVFAALEPANHVPEWAYQLPGSMDSFGLGMIGAVVYVRFATAVKEATAYTRLLTIALCCTPIVFVGLGMWMDKSYETYWSLSWITFLWTPLFSFAVLIIVLNCAHRNCSVTRLLKTRPLFYLGTISYGVYLWHAPVGSWLLKLSFINEMEGYQFPRLALAMFLTSVAIATLSWFLIEARVIALAKSRT